MGLFEPSTPDIEPNNLSLKEAAKYYTSLGMRVFPLSSNSKVPIKHWNWKQACTRDPDTIESWWTMYPNANIGLVTGEVNNVLVLDVDMKDGQNGIGSYQALAQEVYSGPVQLTPTGGQHLLFKYKPGLKNFVRKGAFGGLDMRSDNGYIVVAPSVVDGRRYRWSQIGSVPSTMPPRVWETCVQWSEGIGATEADAPDCVEDLPNIFDLGLDAKYVGYLETGNTDPWYNPKEKRNDESAAILGVASALMHKVEDAPTVYSLMLDNPFAYACAARHTVGAPERWLWKYGISKAVINYTKRLSPAEVSDFFEPVTPEPMALEPATPPSFFRKVGEIELKPPEWIIEGVMEVAQVGVLYGDPSVGKTFTLLDLALHIVCGRKWHNQKTYKTGSVLYITNEGVRSLRLRIEAWWQHYNFLHRLDPGFTPVSMDVIDGGGLYLSEKGVNLLDVETLAPVRDMVQSLPVPPVLIIVDTLASNMAGEENSSKDISALTNCCKAMSNAWGSTVLMAHHSGVQDKDRMRGSSAIRGNVDFVIRQATVEKALVKTVELALQKNRDGDLAHALYFELQIQHLINVTGQDGAPASSLALKQIPKSSSLVDAVEQTRFSVAQADALNTAMECIEEKRTIGDSKDPYASFEELWGSHDQFLRDTRKTGTKATFQKSVTSLVRAGKLAMDVDRGTVWYSLIKPRKRKKLCAH